MLSHRCCRRHFVAVVALWRLLPIVQVRSFSTEPQLPPSFTGVRISLYPKVKDSQSLKQTIKDAVAGITDLGVAVKPDDVSSALVGPEPALFEAVRAVFGRACRAKGEPHVSMICTFSAGCPEELLSEDDEADEDAAPAEVANRSRTGSVGVTSTTSSSLSSTFILRPPRRPPPPSLLASRLAPPAAAEEDDGPALPPPSSPYSSSGSSESDNRQITPPPPPPPPLPVLDMLSSTP